MVAGGLDQDALLRLLLSRRASVIGYIVSIVRDAHLAEDVFQTVSLLVLKKGGEIEDPEQFGGWVRRAARFEALNALRKARNAPRPLDEAVLDALEDHWRSADASAGTEDALRDCVGKLTDRNRKLVELRYRDGLNGAALAERLAQPLNTVYVALSRIHRMLAGCVRSALAAEGIRHG